MGIPGAGAEGIDNAAAVEDQGRRFVEAVNSSDAALRAKAIAEICAPAMLEDGGADRVIGLLDRLHERLGELTYHHSEAMSFGDRATMHVYAKSGMDGRWHDLQFQLEPSAPHRITNIVFVAEVSEPVYLPSSPITSTMTLDWLGRYVSRLAGGDDLSGGILAAQGDSVLFTRTFGYADAARTRRVGPRTRFSMASGGKMFTALAVARFVERGELRYEDTIDRWIPALADSAFAHQVTIAQLLSHTSGIGEYWTDDYERHRDRIRTLADFLPFVLAAGRTSEPGAKYQYSNSNFILAGLVLEKVAGKPYDEVVRTEVFAPAGLVETSLTATGLPDTLTVEPLDRDGTRWKPCGKAGEARGRGSSAGGALTTLTDMLRFGRALVGGKIVSPATLAVMTTTQNGRPAESGQGYGYGFILEGHRAAQSFGHGGITCGVNFEFRYWPASDVTLVAFSNQNNGAYDDLRKNTSKLISGER
jgi:D-alanyl-D-alanine carboxypeptidase